MRRSHPIPHDPHGRDQPSSHFVQSPASPSAPVKGLENMPSRRFAVADFDEFLREMDAGIGYAVQVDRKSTRLNSSHVSISYAVFCLKKKKTTIMKTMHSTDTHSA